MKAITFLSVAIALLGAWFMLPSNSIEFDTTEQDLGRMAAGSTVSTKFKFKNNGRQSVRIKEVRSSCDCLVAESSRGEVAPGQEGQISANLVTSAAQLPGRITRDLQVVFADGHVPDQLLRISADVAPDISIEPFGSVRLSRSGLRGSNEWAHIIVRRDTLPVDHFREVYLTSPFGVESTELDRSDNAVTFGVRFDRNGLSIKRPRPIVVKWESKSGGLKATEIASMNQRRYTRTHPIVIDCNLPQLSIEPEQFFLTTGAQLSQGLNADLDCKREFLIKSAMDTKIAVQEVKFDTEKTKSLFEWSTKENNPSQSELLLILRLRNLPAARYINGHADITVYTGPAGETYLIRLPIRCFVQSLPQ